MKYTIFIFISFLICCETYDQNSSFVNQFSSAQDTLVIKTEKREGVGLFDFGAGSAYFQDTSSTFPYEIKYPANLTEVRRMLIPNSFKNNTHNVDVLLGFANGKKTFLVDENNNNDLTDDPQRLLDRISWYDNKGSIKVEYNYIDDIGQEKLDSSWIKLGSSGGRVWFARNQNLYADFKIAEDAYQVQIQDQPSSSSFVYSIDHSEITISRNNTLVKDTIYEADILKIGEILNLNDNYYRFDSISMYGDYIRLVREGSFDDKIGTQAGMLAPSFSFVSVEGDTLSSDVFNSRIWIVANSCGCGGDTVSTQAIVDITEKYGNDLDILHLDSHLKPGKKGIHINMDNKYNKDLYNKYRGMYCSRIYHVIGKDGRVLNKFNGADWETVLPDLITFNKE